MLHFSLAHYSLKYLLARLLHTPLVQRYPTNTDIQIYISIHAVFILTFPTTIGYEPGALVFLIVESLSPHFSIFCVGYFSSASTIAESSSSGSGSDSAPLIPSEDLSQAIQVKLDKIPRLPNSAGYCSWCSIAMLYFRSRSLWKILDSTQTKPTAPADLEKWELRNITAQLFLTSIVDISISHIISEALSVRDAWQALQGKFEYRNPTTLYTSVKSFFPSMSMANNNTMLNYINGYENYLRLLI